MANASIQELYSNDVKFLKSKKIPLNHRPEFDILDVHCYGYNQRITMEHLNEKDRLFIQLQRLANCKNVICRSIEVSFATKVDWICCKKRSYTFAQLAVFEDLSKKKTYQPLCLQNIAAAPSIKILNSLQSHQLLAVFKMVKNKGIFIRAGLNHERKLYSFVNIVKHFMYKKEIEPLASIEYFVNVVVNPSPFCIQCGLFQKIEKSMCWCKVCTFLRIVGVFTSNIEKPYHTK